MLNKRITITNDGKYVSSIAIIGNDALHVTTQFLALRPNGRKAKKRMKRESCFARSNHDGTYTVGTQCVINANALATMLSRLRQDKSGELYFAEDNE